MDWSKCTSDHTLTGVPTLNCITNVYANVINWAFVFAGVTAVIFVILGGIRILLSGGDKTAVESGRKTVTYAIAGLVVILLSFFIIKFIGYVTGTHCIEQFGFEACP